MIRLKYMYPLLKAKLRARPGRSAIIVGISSVLFGIALAGMTIVDAGLDSAAKFSEAKFGGHYYVQASYLEDTSALTNNEWVQQKAKAIYDADLTAKKSEAARLGIDFDPRTVAEPLKQVPGGNKGETVLDLTAPAAMQAVEEYRAAHPGIGIDDLKKLAEPYAPAKVMSLSGINVRDGAMSLMLDGKEVFPSIDAPIDMSYDFLARAPLRLMNNSVMQSFIDSNVQTSSEEVPVLLPYSAATTILGLDSLGRDATSMQKLERLEYLHKHAIGVAFTACYRNTTSKAQIDQATNREDNGSASSIEYSLPDATSCGAANVVKDTRTEQERAQTEKQQQFDERFGIQHTPVQQKVSFRIVGLVPDDSWVSHSSKFDASDAVRLLFGPALLGQATITTQAYDGLSAQLKSLFQKGGLINILPTDTYLVEFTNPEDARQFIKEQSCDRIQGAACGTSKYPFQLTAFGSNAVALLDFRDTVSTVSNYIIGAIVVVAIIIMAGTFGKIIADERRDIAVFQVVGATRTDITLIYMGYALVLSLFAVVIAIVIGQLLAIIAHAVLVVDTTVAMRLTYGVLDKSITMEFYAINIQSILLIGAATVATGLVSVLAPLQKGIDGDPTKDLKGE